ncbi:hypothetical protein I5M32_12130 [Pedobacter sp. SD-b]|uniref:GLUG domain-containing protein n=1 Tax=Pedobacter segetis TaxID=2793069 RepID=A0ABS1BLE6_9SPHI|nr:hypothetical protein [Pedobacter segetis]MBK0383707.1 hypothetical protein [Pedobacter segetis]
MKIKYKYLPILVLIATLVWSCKKDELASVDSMLSGLNAQTLKAAEKLNASNWSTALVGLREERIKVFTRKKLIADGKYTGDRYTVKDPASAIKNADETIATVDFKIDSLWKANIKNDFDALDPKSAGIANFGLKAYETASEKFTAIYAWLKEETDNPAATVYTANDLDNFKLEIAVLTDLNNLKQDDVIKFVNDLKAQFNLMKQQYADLASPIASSPYFSKAQKGIYSDLNQRLNDLETIINTKLELSTKAQVDSVDRDLSALVYFVANNYVSPAQKPIIFGQIASITELRWLSEVATDDEKKNNWRLMVDIDAAETKRWNATTTHPGFQQIDNFNGTFDGQNHIINGLFMKNSQAGPNHRIGFFDNITGNIKNLGLVNAYVEGVSGASGQGGVLFGRMTDGSVSNCFTTGVMERNSQSGGFFGRTAGTVNVENCFSSVDTSKPNDDKVTNTASFIGLPTGAMTLKNCYTTGANPDRVVFGFGAGLRLVEASGFFYDPSTVGNTNLDNNGYAKGSPVRMKDAGVTTALPTNKWDDLSNFPGFSPSMWEIKTVTEIDANPRPYLKGFNYGALKDFIKP